MKYHFDVRGAAHLLLVLSATLVVYVLTMPRTISLEDAGLFQMVCHLGGIGHPPGYPLFTNLCQSFVQLPIFSPGVFAGNFLSALFAALSCSVLYSCCLSITKDQLVASVAALAYGFSATFWSQAIIIEVYSLTVLMFLLCWRALLSFAQSGNIRFLYLAIFVYGASLANHWPLMVLSTPALLVTVLPRLDTIISSLKSPGFWLRSIVALLIGLSPYATILLTRDAAISVYGDVDSVGELGRYVARSAYSDQHAIATSADHMRYILWLLVESATQFGLVGFPLMLIGFAVCFKKLPRSIAISLVLMYLGSTFLLNLLLNFRYENFWQAIFKPYPVVSYLALAIWLACGTRVIVDWLGSNSARAARLIPWVVTGIVVSSILLANLYENNRRNTTWVEQYGRSVLESLPKDAVFFARGDFEIGILGFLHLVMGVRPDIELRSWDNLVLANRLVSPFSSDEIQQAKRTEFLEGNARPVLGSTVPLAPAVQQGAYYRFTPGVAPSAERNPPMDLILDHLLDLYKAGLITDPHEIHFAYHRLISFTRQYVGLALAHQDLSNVEFERLARLQSTFPGKLVILETILHQGSGNNGKVALSEIAQAAEAQIPPFATRESLAVFYEFYGRIMMMEPANNKKAISYFEQSIDTYPVPDNTSICPLLSLYLTEMDSGRANALGQRFSGLNCR